MKRLSILALYSMVATPAIADIASTSYVDGIIDSLAPVATSGSYNDLSNKPTIPAAANNATLTIQRNGTTVGTWTSNASSNNTINITDNDTTYSAMTGATSSAAGTSGLVPAPAKGKQKSFLRGDGTWVVPTNTTYSAMTGASSDKAGTSGLVPAPTAGKQTSFLRGDGTWVVPTDTNTTYSAMTGATSSAAGTSGLVPAPAAGKQTSFLRGDGTWVVPTDTTYTTGNESTSGLTKLYTSTGTSTDGTMTRNAITSALSGKQNTISDLSTIRSGASAGATAVQPGSLAPVATSGSYNDLSNKPTIPAAQVNADWNATSGIAQILNKPTIPTITNTYDTTSTNGMSGKAVASAISAHNSSSAAHSDIRNALNTKVTIPSGGSAGQVLKKQSDGSIGWANDIDTDTNTTYSVMGAASSDNAGTSGLVPAPAAGKQTSFLRGDGTWVVPTDTNTTYTTGNESTSGLTKLYASTGTSTDGTMTRNAITSALGAKVTIPSGGSAGQVLKKQSDGSIGWANDIDTDTNTTYSVMGAASANNAGTSGLVPAPAKGDQGKFLKGDATWTSLATVATSGSYNDLSNKPTIPAAQVNADWNATSGIAQILNKPTIPAITDTYDTTSTNGMSGKAVASAISAHNSSSAAHSDIRNALSGKQNTLSETQLAAVNSGITSTLVGKITANESAIAGLDSTYATDEALISGLAGKQDSLISGTNIKTVNNTSLLGTGNIAVQPTITGGATTIASSNLTASRALISNSSGKVAVSAVTSTELGYLDGVTSNIQTQLNGKQASLPTNTATDGKYKLVWDAALGQFILEFEQFSLQCTAPLYDLGFTQCINSGTNGTGNTSSNAAATWRTTFNYGILSGVSSCNTTRGKASGQTMSSDSFNQGDETGEHCWCKMTGPVDSMWVFDITSTAADGCRGMCASHCANQVQTNANFRAAVFNSIGAMRTNN